MSENTPVITADAEIKFKDDLITASNAIEQAAAASIASTGASGTVVLGANWAFDPAFTAAGVTEESYANHRAHEDLITNAATLAGTKIATKLFQENPDLQTVTVTGGVYKKTGYEGTFKREGTSRNVKTGEVSSYKGAIGVGRLNVVSSRTNAEWQSIKQNFRTLAEAAGL